MKGIVYVALVSLTITLVAYLTAPPSAAYAATPDTLNFQARLETSSGAIVPDGNYNVTFHLYNASTTVSGSTTDTTCGTDPNCLWEESYTATSGSGGSDVRVRVANGYLSVNLGSVTAFPTSINWDQQLWLTMDIGGTGAAASWDGQMSPRLELTSVPYAFQSQSAEYLGELQGSATDSLQFATDTANSNTITLPDLNGTFGLMALQTSTNVQQTGGFNVSGMGIMGNAQVGAPTGNPGQLTVYNSVATQRALVLQAASGQSVDVLDIYNGSGNFVSGYDANGNEYLNGKLVTGTTSQVGEIDFKDGTASNYTTYLVNQALSSSQTIYLPDASGTVCLQSSTSCGFLTGSGAGVQLQSATPGTAQTGSFNVSGTGIAGTKLSAPLIDYAGTLDIGTSSATGLTLGRSTINTNVVGGNIFLNGNTSILSGGTFNVQSGYAAISGLNVTNSTPTLTVNSHSSGASPLVVQSSDTTVLTVSNGGSTTFENATNSTSALQVQNSSGTTILNVDTSNGYVGIDTASPQAALQIAPGNTGNVVVGDLNTSDWTGGLYVQGGADGGSGGIVDVPRTAITANPQNATDFIKLADDTYATTAFIGVGSSNFAIVTGLASAITNLGAGTVDLTVQNSTGNTILGTGSTGEATPKLLVLDSGTTSGDTTGVDGAMYYNSNLGRFRCYENTEWKDCIGIDPTDQRVDPFYSTDFISSTDMGPWQSGSVGSSNSGTYNHEPGVASHFGLLRLYAQTSSGCSSAPCGYEVSDYGSYSNRHNSVLIGGGENFELVFSPDNTQDGNSNNLHTDFGFIDNSFGVASTNGVYFAVSGTSIEGICTSGGTSATTTSHTVSTSDWYTARVSINDTATQATFFIKDFTTGSSWSETVSSDIPTTTGTGDGVESWDPAVPPYQTGIIDLDYMALWYSGRSLDR